MSMRGVLVVFGLVLCSGLQAQEAVGPVVPATVLSRSKQFVVSGGDPMMRGVAAILAEQCKDDLLALLPGQEMWKVPIDIVLHGKVGDESPARTIAIERLMVENTPRLQLHKHLGPGMESARFRRAVCGMLILEKTMTAEDAKPEDELMPLPLWLTMGLQEAFDWRKQQGERALYAMVFKRNGLLALNEMLDMTEERLDKGDPAMRDAFRVSAGAMVMALLEQPEGKQAFRKFMERVGAFEGEIPILLRECFPDLNLSANSLAKWWALQLAAKGDMQPLTEVLGIAETENLFAKAVFLQLVDAEGKPQRVALEDWKRLAALPSGERAMAIKSAQMALLHLSYRCFPPYRELIIEYQKLLVRMLQQAPEGVDAALAELRKSREVMLQRALRGRDYLDWFEITRARETSGVFDDYLKLKEELKDRKAQRKDGVSAYLDRMNEAFDRGE